MIRNLKQISLTKREILAVSIGAGGLLLFIVLQLIVFPLLEERDRLISGIAGQKSNVEAMLALSEEYQRLQAGSSSLEQRIRHRDAAFTLFSFLEKAASEAKIKQQIKYMKPSITPTEGNLKISHVEMKLEKITLRQFVDYLHSIELFDLGVFVNRLTVQEDSQEEGFLDVVMQVQTFVQN